MAARLVTGVRRHSVLLACLATVGVHLLFLTRQVGVDEGGFAMVARFAGTSGAHLYGPSWVDRPPGLIAVFAIADRIGPYGPRLVAAVVAVILVATIAWAAETVGGRSAARWTAWTAFAFASSVLLQAQELNGELIAATLVALSLACTLRAVRGSRSTSTCLGYAVAAGLSAAAAVLVKQNFVDGLAFAGVLLVLASTTRVNRALYRPRRLLATAAGFAGGVVVVAAVASVWAGRHGGVSSLLFAMYGFRSAAAAVMAGWSWAAPGHRLAVLAEAGCLSLLLVLLVHLAIRHAHRLRRPDPLPWALVAAVTVELVGIFGGENFWLHYLIALVPTLSLAVGLSVNRRVTGFRITRALVVAAAVVTVVVSPAAAARNVAPESAAYTIGHWVGASSAPGDSLVVPYTHANVIDASGLRPGYPYAWSLPARTRDPHLAVLTHDLTGPGAVTWVVQWDRWTTWGLDAHGQVERALARRYRRLPDICGHPVWLRDGAHRTLAPSPSSSACTGAPR